MNLICNNIHMDMIKCKMTTQMTLEGDINLSENNPDLQRIIFRQASMDIAETKLSEDHVFIKGKMQICALYATDDEDEKLASLSGNIPFEENFFLEGAAPGDNVDIKWHLEDISIGVINSRKVSVRSVVTLGLQIDSVYSEEAGVSLSDTSGVEYYNKQMDITQLAVCKKDIFRLHQEISIPAALPNIYRVIWNSINITNFECKPLDDKLNLTGELSLFVLYENAQEDDNISFYETVVPFSSVIECFESREMMIPDISWEIASHEFDVKPDFDGEERMLCTDVTVNLSIKLYEENCIHLLSDIYGLRSQIQTESKLGQFRKILVRNEGKCRIKETIALEDNAQIFQIIHSEGEACLEDQTILEDGVELNGVVSVRCLYVTSDDKMPYMSVTKEIPFTYFLEAKNVHQNCACNIGVKLSQLSIVMTDSSHLEAGIIVDITGIFMDEFSQQLIYEVKEEPFDKASWKALPQIAVYVVQPGDSLWKIGRQFVLPVSRIKELNNLKDDEIRPGQKLIILKEKG